MTGAVVRVQKGDALTRLTADQVEFGATIAYNRLRNPNHIEVGQDLWKHRFISRFCQPISN
jgi:LysM repeat protein